MRRRDEIHTYGELLQLVPLGDEVANKRPVDTKKLNSIIISFRTSLHLFGIVVVIPTLMAILFFGFVAADRYEAEARFVIRSSTRSVSSALANLLQSTGVTQATDDAYAVREYMLSRDAMRLLDADYGLKAALSRPEGDLFWRFPNFYTPNGVEGLYRVYQRLVSVNYDATTGVITLTVEAFRATDAQRLASGLLAAGEQLVNRLNERAHRDAFKFALAEVDRLEQRVISAQQRLTAFQNREAILDPGQASKPIMESIGRLSVDAAEANMQLAELQHISPRGPQLGTLRGRLAAIEGQIAKEQLRLAGDTKSLSLIYAEYERLMLEREFSEMALTTALGAVEVTRAEAQRQQIYLERVAAPSVPDYPAYPYRLVWILFIFAVSYMLYRLLVVLLVDTRRHAAA